MEPVTTREIYRSADHRSWVSWVCTWLDDASNLYLSFQEIRRGKNHLWEAIPLDFWESMALPVGYHETLCNGSRDLITEFVVLKSTDLGANWSEISREATKFTASFSWVSGRSGQLIRSMCNDYVAWHRNEPQETWCERSADGGRTWTRQSSIMVCHNASGTPHRLRRLRDGTLVQLISAEAPFGPGRERYSRHTRRANVRQEIGVCLYFSGDDGVSWTGPVTALPGIYAPEPDMVELPNGELLVLNSAVQGGPQVRQYIRRGTWGWIPEPVYDVAAGQVPECAVCTRSGVIIGAIRDAEFTFSQDEGETWSTIPDVPACGYQPFIVELPDGRFFCAWHGGGGDESFGKKILHIGGATFSISEMRACSCTLVLRRVLNESRTQYLNSFTATLSVNSKPVPFERIFFAYCVKGAEQWIQSSAITDSIGRAVLNLEDTFRGEKDIHASYQVKAWAAPTRTGQIKCQSATYAAYVNTLRAQELGSGPVERY